MGCMENDAKEAIKAYKQEFARKGGQARAKKLSSKRRSEIAKLAAEARIKKLNQTPRK
jgi:hypothetical protein